MLSALTWLLVTQSRYYLRFISSRRWPSTSATIEKAYVGKIQGLGGRAGFFSYRFTVQGVDHTGRFLIIDDEEHAQKLQTKLDGLPIVVNYNQRDPRMCFIVDLYDPRFEGHAARQNPYWFYGASSLPKFQSMNLKK
jgi:hypothetical protein